MESGARTQKSLVRSTIELFEQKSPKSSPTISRSPIRVNFGRYSKPSSPLFPNRLSRSTFTDSSSPLKPQVKSLPERNRRRSTSLNAEDPTDDRNQFYTTPRYKISLVSSNSPNTTRTRSRAMNRNRPLPTPPIKKEMKKENEVSKADESQKSKPPPTPTRDNRPLISQTPTKETPRQGLQRPSHPDPTSPTSRGSLPVPKKSLPPTPPVKRVANVSPRGSARPEPSANGVTAPSQNLPNRPRRMGGAKLPSPPSGKPFVPPPNPTPTSTPTPLPTPSQPPQISQAAEVPKIGAKETKRKELSKKDTLFRLFSKSKKNIYENRLAEHLKELETDSGADSFLFSSIISEVEKLDTWTSKVVEKKDWSLVESQEIGSAYTSLMDVSQASIEGFRFEFGRNGIPYQKDSQISIEQLELDTPFYQEQMAYSEHVNFLSEGEEEGGIGAAILSMEPPSEEGEERKAIIRTKKTTDRLFIPGHSTTSTGDMIKFLKTFNSDLQPLKFTKSTWLELPPKLIEYDAQMVVQKYKFGILYVKENQTDENEMFSNVETSPEYEEFLDFIGEKIVLKGWDKYRGGLNVNNDATGTHSVYTQHRGYEIMFHVSTLLPFQPDDLQRVERKRHLGNDIVCIIYKEGDFPFDPLSLTTHFTNIFLVIQKDKSFTHKTHYKLAIANKTGVPPYGPYLKYPPVYEKNDYFRDFLLSKLINSERAAMQSPDFKGKMIRTNKQLLADITKNGM